MTTLTPSLSAIAGNPLNNAGPGGGGAPPAALTTPGILADNWPTLARALGQYTQATAEEFSRLAYAHVHAGLIRRTDRTRLAAAAENLGIRSFDAQLLIACAIRQWSLDHAFDPTPEKAPRLAPEYRTNRDMWMRVAAVVGWAVFLDGVILWKWLG